MVEYRFACWTDVGIKKKTNQDSACIKEAETPRGRVLLATICDGMGGLSKGELASAELIRAFSKWFDTELPQSLTKSGKLEEIRSSWDRIIQEQNRRIGEYGRKQNIQLGSTLTVMLILEDLSFLIGHVGDSRAYRITNAKLELITEDQTVVALEVSLGEKTAEEAKKDPRRNILLQCVGASEVVNPTFYTGQIKKDECYVLCSDGFCHQISEQEIHEALKPSKNILEEEIRQHLAGLVEIDKSRREQDNITALLLRIV